MEKQLKRGYSNEIILYGIITEMFRTDYNVSIGIAVRQQNVRMQNDYPKILFYDSENGKINIDTLAENFDAGTWVKIEGHIQTVPGYANTEKRVPYQTIVGDVIEKIDLENIPEKRNRVVLSGYVANIRQPKSHLGLVRLMLLTKRNYHESYVHCLVYPNDADEFVDKIREKDFLYTIGMIETRRVASNGRWSTYEDYVVKEIYRENRETKKARMFYCEKTEKEKILPKIQKTELDFDNKDPDSAEDSGK